MEKSQQQCTPVNIGFRGTAPKFTRPQRFEFLSVGTLKTFMCLVPLENEKTLQQRNFNTFQTISNGPGTFETVRQSIIRRLHACDGSGGEYFEHVL